ncbi:MAG TPA: FAD-binding protein, partial [Microbacterium sp.]|nr:FAD-binding protein [Microbacterium sp.]
MTDDRDARVVSALIDELGAELVVTNPDALQAYRRDRAEDPTAGTPLAVVRATSTEDVQAAVRIAAREGVGIVPRGAGSGLSGGSSAVDGAI